MSARMKTSKWVAGLLLVCATPCLGPAFADKKPEDVLAGKGLYRTGAMYASRTEDAVKKAADAAQAKLKEYRLAAAREKDGNRSEEEKKALLAELTQQRTALREQLDQEVPAIRTRMRELSQQQAAMRQELNQLRSAARYTANNFAAAGHNEIVDNYNAITDQIDLLAEQGSQLTTSYNELSARIRQLGGDSEEAKPAGRKPPQAADRRAEYAQALQDLRKAVGEATATYAGLKTDPEVKEALETLNRKSVKIQYVLGPTRRFQDQVKALEQAEAKLADDSLLDEKPQPARRKAKSAKKRR